MTQVLSPDSSWDNNHFWMTFFQTEPFLKITTFLTQSNNLFNLSQDHFSSFHCTSYNAMVKQSFNQLHFFQQNHRTADQLKLQCNNYFIGWKDWLWLKFRPTVTLALGTLWVKMIVRILKKLGWGLTIWVSESVSFIERLYWKPITGD